MRKTGKVSGVICRVPQLTYFLNKAIQSSKISFEKTFFFLKSCMIENNGWLSEQLSPKVRVVLGIAIVAAGLSGAGMGFFSLLQVAEHAYFEVDAGSVAAYTEVTGLCLPDSEYFWGYSQPFLRVSAFWPDRLEFDSGRFACRVP